MIDDGIIIRQNHPKQLEIENLPDGSTAVFDNVTHTVHSLHPVAAAAFRSCREGKTLPEMRDSMSRSLDTSVSEASALAAVAELERAGLVSLSGSGSSRRTVLTSVLQVAGAAMPLVLSLTASEQSVFAAGATSGTTTTSTTTTTTSTTTTTTTTTTTAGPIAFLASITPNFIGNCVGTANGYVITGVNTHFTSASVVTFSNAAVTASNVVANSATSITLSISPGNVILGPLSITVKTGTETATGANLLNDTGCA